MHQVITFVCHSCHVAWRAYHDMSDPFICPECNCQLYPEKIKIRDTVTVIKSPYSDVPNGTEAVVTEIKPHHLGFGLHLYYLGLPDHKSFWGYEIAKKE
jgi:hypothetical protein